MYHTGSSPLTRGKLKTPASASSSRGLIPAHAGKTASCIGLPAPSWAHPRSRGENSMAVWKSSRETGSSPLTRGKPGRPRRPTVGPGLIPAHAGKTVSVPNLPPKGTAHPRSRGENCGRRFRSRLATGSSPLTRGKPDAPHNARDCDRLIPAHAGKTWGGASGPSSQRAHPRSRGENPCR